MLLWTAHPASAELENKGEPCFDSCPQKHGFLFKKNNIFLQTTAVPSFKIITEVVFLKATLYINYKNGLDAEIPE